MVSSLPGLQRDSSSLQGIRISYMMHIGEKTKMEQYEILHSDYCLSVMLHCLIFIWALNRNKHLVVIQITRES
jgi:hypothetical protein